MVNKIYLFQLFLLVFKKFIAFLNKNNFHWKFLLNDICEFMFLFDGIHSFAIILDSFITFFHTKFKVLQFWIKVVKIEFKKSENQKKNFNMGNSQSNQPSSLDIFQNKQYMRFIESTTKRNQNQMIKIIIIVLCLDYHINR